jgi:hypothetical protein
VLSLHRETKSARLEAVAKNDARLNEKAQAQILESFPSIPHDLIPDILNHTLKKKSGRVGRTTTIPFEESIDLAVRAFIRHKCTDYDKFLREGIEQKSAREKIRGESERVVGEWKIRGNEKKPQSRKKETTNTETKRGTKGQVIDLTNC